MRSAFFGIRQELCTSALDFPKENQSLTINYTNTGMMPAEVTLSATGKRPSLFRGAIENPDTQGADTRNVSEMLIECDQFQIVIEAHLRDKQIHGWRDKAAPKAFLPKLRGIAPEPMWSRHQRQKLELRLHVFPRSRGRSAK
jgi:hypothetical protein